MWDLSSPTRDGTHVPCTSTEPPGKSQTWPDFVTRAWRQCLTRICCYCSVAKSCPTLCDPMDCSTPGFPILHHLPEFAQIHVHWVSDAIQPSHPLPSPSPPACNLSQNQGLFQWAGSSHHVAKMLKLQIKQQSFQWIFSAGFPLEWTVWSPWSLRDSQESSPAPQVKSISSLALSLHGPTFTSVRDY